MRNNFFLSGKFRSCKLIFYCMCIIVHILCWFLLTCVVSTPLIGPPPSSSATPPSGASSSTVIRRWLITSPASWNPFLMQYTIEVQNNVKIFDGNEMQMALRTTFPVLLRKLYQDDICDKDNRRLTFFPEGLGNMVPTAVLLNFSAVGLFLISPA